MGFDIKAIEGEKWEVVFSDEPSYVHALKMAPAAMEPGVARNYGSFRSAAFSRLLSILASSG